VRCILKILFANSTFFGSFVETVLLPENAHFVLEKIKMLISAEKALLFAKL
jgi:hypothetical protein